jgi:hypothetical protein
MSKQAPKKRKNKVVGAAKTDSPDHSALKELQKTQHQALAVHAQALTAHAHALTAHALSLSAHAMALSASAPGAPVTLKLVVTTDAGSFSVRVGPSSGGLSLGPGDFTNSGDGSYNNPDVSPYVVNGQLEINLTIYPIVSTTMGTCDVTINQQSQSQLIVDYPNTNIGDKVYPVY